MSKVLLVVTFRTHQQFTAEPGENRLDIIKQRIDIANAGTLVQEDGPPGCFTFSLPCKIDFGSAPRIVNLNQVIFK